jgi:Polyketide cyclase / dehydrase and lipid transport/Phospholipase_D-nuclease N-terminal
VQADANAPVFATGELDVAADPETVWEVMADIGRWPAWNPDITAATVQGPVQPGTSFRWKSGPGTIRSTFQVVQRPTELSWTGKTMGIPAIHVYRLRASDQQPGHSVVRLEESWDGPLARLLRRPFTRTLQTAIDTGLARLKTEAERRARGDTSPRPVQASGAGERKRWSELSSRQRTAIVAAGALQVTLAAAALLDLRRRPAEQVRGPKQLWAAAAFVNFVGPLAYFLFGRRRT